jgi:hypothetical protein
MSDFSQYQYLGAASDQADYYLIDSDILLAVAKPNMIDTPQLAQANADFQTVYLRQLGKKGATIVIMSDILAQDAVSRRIYSDLLDTGLFYGLALVVDKPLSRALASFIIGFSKAKVPTKLFDTVEKAIEWLRTIRP